MTNATVIENKISSIQRYLAILVVYKEYSLEEIYKDVTLRGAVERYLYLLSQATIDLAEAIISYKGFRKPTTYSEAFDILKDETILFPDLADRLVKMTGFRNLIAHDYERIDFSIIYDVLTNHLCDVEDFLVQVRDKLHL